MRSPDREDGQWSDYYLGIGFNEMYRQDLGRLVEMCVEHVGGNVCSLDTSSRFVETKTMRKVQESPGKTGVLGTYNFTP